MNDADTRIKDLINSAVDRELDGHRTAPPLDRFRLAERPPLAHPVARWSVPVLAAVVAALLTVGGMLAIGYERDQRSNPPANSISPAPTPSVSRIPEMDLQQGPRAYEEAMAGAQEASEVAGVSVGPLSAEDAAQFKDSGLWSLSGAAPEAPELGKSYPITVRYLAGPSDEWVSIVSGELRDVASGSCPQPFRVRPGHTYLIRCQVTFLAGAVGKATFAKRSPWETVIYSFNLGNSVSQSASSPPPFNLAQEERSIIPGRAEAAREYSKAVASAPEANKVAGVSDRPTTAEDGPMDGEGVGMLDGPISAPKRDKSYPLTLIYVPPADAPAISVLAIEFVDVAAGRCPRAFRVRPGHAYTIRCQVTFRAGAVGMANYRLTEPYGESGNGMTISLR